MVVTGDGFQVERNLVMHNLWPGSYEGRVEVKNVFYEGSFELRNAGPITFRENVVCIAYLILNSVVGQEMLLHAGFFALMRRPLSQLCEEQHTLFFSSTECKTFPLR